MSKRLLEFTCGDPKSNQQTASKVDCQITINNTNTKDVGDKPAAACNKKVRIQHQQNDTAIQFYTEHDNDDEHNDDEHDEHDVEQTRDVYIDSSDVEEVKNLKVKIPVNREVVQTTATSSRFYVTSRNPAVLREEILGSITVKDELIRILTKILVRNDKQLLANLLDRSGKIIIDANDFSKLLSVMLSSSGKEVKPADIKVKYNEEFVTSCLKVKVSPFKHVVNVQVGEQDLKLHQYEAYNVLTNDFNISADVIYYVEPDDE